MSLIGRAKLLQVSSEVDGERDRLGLEVFSLGTRDKSGNTLGRMYTPLKPDLLAIIPSISCSASRFVSMYRAEMRGLKISSAET